MNGDDVEVIYCDYGSTSMAVLAEARLRVAILEVKNVLSSCISSSNFLKRELHRSFSQQPTHSFFFAGRPGFYFSVGPF